MAAQSGFNRGPMEQALSPTGQHDAGDHAETNQVSERASGVERQARVKSFEVEEITIVLFAGCLCSDVCHCTMIPPGPFSEQGRTRDELRTDAGRGSIER